MRRPRRPRRTGDGTGDSHDGSRRPATGNRHWLWLLVLPRIAMLWVPSYNAAEPALFGFFFYWYQLLWVLLSAVITALVYFKTGACMVQEGRNEPRRHHGLRLLLRR